jgi:predicted dehydrogenase
MSFQTNRRSFLIATGLTALASSRALGANDTLRIGVIGAGGRMKNLLDAADKVGLYQIAAVADVYKPRVEAVLQRDAAKSGGATSHLHYQEVFEKDVDAVFIASPDHWHVKMATDALAAHKDVYLEKPVTHSIDEGAGLIKAVHASKQILQCGMQQRSWPHFRDAVDLIQAGTLGRIVQIRTFWWQNYTPHFSLEPDWTSADRPLNIEDLDWKLWLGSAPEQPFTKEKYFLWRWFWNFGGGAMTDLFTHWIDIVHWAMKSDTPKEAFMMGDKFFFDSWDCPDTIQAALRYPNFDVVYEGNMVSSIDDGGLEFRGTEATLKLNRGGMSLSRERIPGKSNPILSETSAIDGTTSHVQNFFDCIKSRKTPNAPVEAGVAAARAGQIANLAHQNNGHVTWPLKG